MLGQFLQDATLNFFRGIAYPSQPVTDLFVSLHSDADADDVADISSVVGGRIALPLSALSDPQFISGLTSGEREIVNLTSLVSGNASANDQAASFAVWTQPVGGDRMITGQINPLLQIKAGNPVILLQGELSIRLA